MSHLTLGMILFAATYLLNIFYISVLYHRGLTHGAVTLRPWMRKWVIWTGNWVTGLDPKAWSCMHRLHHQHSDTAKDPHSPVPNGIFSVMHSQLRSYERVLRGLQKGSEPYRTVAADLDFPPNWLNRNRLWYAPYLLHASVGVGLAFATHSPWVGLAYWAGMMSHPVQGWAVNALGHRFGYRNFDTGDNSRNNTLVAILIFGEGYQNNHHHRPASARFSSKWWEIDLGYGLCHLAQAFGLLEIQSTSKSSRRVFQGSEIEKALVS